MITVTRKPTIESPLGTYKVIDENGIYWGCWKVCRAWTCDIAIIQVFAPYK